MLYLRKSSGFQKELVNGILIILIAIMLTLSSTLVWTTTFETPCILYTKDESKDVIATLKSSIFKIKFEMSAF